MNTRYLLVPLLAALFCASPIFAEPAPPLSDAEATRLLAAEWKETPEAPVLSAGTTLKPDGTLSGSATIGTPAGGQITITVDGKWRVEHGVVIEEVTRSSEPKFVPVGTITRDTVISVTAKEYRYRTEDGKEVTCTRVADEAKPAALK